MIFGFIVRPVMLVYGGGFLFVLLLLQILVGMRWIRFKGRAHLKVHKWGAWALLVLALLHGSMGVVYALELIIG